MNEIYLDNAATTKVYPKVVAAMKEVLVNNYGNPSSLHKIGLTAEKKVKAARAKIAKEIATEAKNIYFTSGGTEANNLAIKGAARALKNYGKTIITTKIAHPSVIKTCQDLREEGFTIKYVPVDKTGRIDLATLENFLNEDTILLTLLAVNNELGTIQPLSQISKLLKDYDNTYFHVDGVQALGKTDDLSVEEIDLLTISSHKIHGPKGVGVLYKSDETRLKSLLSGSKQELGLRPGTENVPGIVGFGEAVELLTRIDKDKLFQLKKKLYQKIKAEITDFKLNGPAIKQGAPHILNISFKDIKGEVLVHSLEQDEIYISTGAACSSKDTNSHVLSDVPESKYKEGTVRISFSSQNSLNDIKIAAEKIIEYVKELRKFI